MSITFNQPDFNFYDEIEKIIPHQNHLSPPPDSIMNSEFNQEYYISPTIRIIVYLIHVREMIDIE